MSRFNFDTIALSSRADASKIGDNFNKIEANAVLKTDKVTTTDDGLMSKEDKVKLNGVAENANNYSLPTAARNALGGVKTSSTVADNKGYIATPIINGIPYYKDTTYSNATQAANGLLSKEDKSKIDSLKTVATTGDYDDLTDIPIYNAGNVVLNDGEDIPLTIGGTYSILSLTVNDNLDSEFNHSICRVYEASGKTYISIIAGNNMTQDGYNYYAYKYENSEWAKISSRIMYSTADLTPGESALETGTLYFVYEE